MHMRGRKLVTRSLAPVALALGVSFLIGARDPSAAGAGVSSVGGGSFNFGDSVKVAKFAFSGHTGPHGDFGSFRFTIEAPNFEFDVHVDVDCVNVFPFSLGAGGWIGGPVKEATPQPNWLGIIPGDQLLFGFNDFGEPSDPIPDELRAYFGAPQWCKDLGPENHVPIDHGNIVVKTGPKGLHGQGQRFDPSSAHH